MDAPGLSRCAEEPEIAMSMLNTIGRYGAALRKAHARGKAVRMLNSLPPEVQKDIGWPVVPRHGSQTADLLNAIWGGAR